MSYTNTGLVEWAKGWLQKTTRYGWGCWGQPISEAIIMQKYSQYPSHYNHDRRDELRELIGEGWLLDCVGLIKGYYWGGTIGGNIGYKGFSDESADSMYTRSNEKGPISTIPEIPGLCVQMNGHIGIYCCNGIVIESTRSEVFGDGVVQTRLSDRPWLHWLKCPYITYEEVNDVAVEKAPTGNNPTDWAEEATSRLIKEGFFVGDGQGNYDWQGPLTREAYATTLYKVLIRIGYLKEE